MSKQRILMIVALCFVLIGTVAAGIPHEPKPDSLVECVGFGQYAVQGLTVPASIDESECAPFQLLSCSTCIRSLENQGCEVDDVNLSTITVANGDVFSQSVFVLSCESP
jgi:hypothetical protein